MSVSLVRNCLQTLQSFLSWIPSGYIFMTNIIDEVIVEYLQDKRFVLVTLKCFEEVFSIKILEEC